MEVVAVVAVGTTEAQAGGPLPGRAAGGGPLARGAARGSSGAVMDDLPPVGAVVSLDHRCGPDFADGVERFRVTGAMWASPVHRMTVLLRGYRIHDEGITVDSCWLRVHLAGIEIVEEP